MVSALPTKCIPRLLSREISGIHFACPFRGFFILKEKVQVRKKPEISKDSREIDESLIEVLSAKVIMGTKRAAKMAFAVHTGIAEYGGLSNDVLVADPDEKR